MGKRVDTHSKWVYSNRGIKREPQQKGGERLKDNYIAENLRELRKRKGVTQAEVAKALGMPYTTYNAYETGQNIPRDDVKVKIANYYGKTVQYIFFRRITHS